MKDKKLMKWLEERLKRKLENPELRKKANELIKFFKSMNYPKPIIKVEE